MGGKSGRPDSDELDQQALLQYEKTKRLSSQLYSSFGRRMRSGLRQIIAELPKAR